MVAEFIEILERHGLTDLEAAALAGVAPSTIRFLRATREAPRHPGPRAHIAEFIRRNAAAQSRGDLRMGAR